MAAFRPEALVDKLNKLNASQQSIETISQWCIFFRKDAKQVVEAWSAEFGKCTDLKKQLAMVYLANDILQNSRTKGGQFVVEFYSKLPSAVGHLFKRGDTKMQATLNRMINVWDERRVFGNSGVKPFTDVVSNAKTPARQRNVVLQTMDPTLDRLVSATQEAGQARQRTATSGARVAEVVCQDISSSSAEDLAGGLKTLQQHSVALQNELGHRERVLSILQHLTQEQEAAKQEAEKSLEGCQHMMERHQHQLQDRQAQEQQTAPPWQGGTGVTMSEATQALPPPANGSHPSPGAPQHYPPAERAHPPDAESPGHLQGPPMGGVGRGDGMTSVSAADLVARLQSGALSSQMLMDAFSTMPQTGEPPPVPQEEEYDPELGM